jgi:glycosyltransferase involved in cell wall biosynthesis
MVKNKYKFTIVILTYNTPYEKLKLSVDSVLKQKFDSLQLIISDDSTEKTDLEQIAEYLESSGFQNYKIRKNVKNLGTVKNCYNALKEADGDYVKILGAGDYLYDEKTVSKMYNFLCNNGYKLGFGRLLNYTTDKIGVIKKGKEYKVPVNIGIYKKNCESFIAEVNTLVCRDYISGASMFGKKSKMIHYIRMLVNVSRYSEDIFQILVYAEGDRFYFLDDYIVNYEYGTGISTNKKNQFKKLLEKDINHSVELATHKYNRKRIYCWLLKKGNDRNSLLVKLMRRILMKL